MPSDVDPVIELLKLSFGFHLSRDWWDWKYRLNPAGYWGEQGDSWVAESEGHVVGHLAVIPQKMKVGPETVTMAQLVDGATHPRYQGLGVFKALIRKLFSDVKGRYRFVFGFPNEKIFRNFQGPGWASSQVVEFYRFLNHESSLGSYFTNDLMTWAGKEGLKALQSVEKLSSRLGSRKREGCPVEIQRVERFPEEMDDFWKTVRPEFETVLERSAAFLNWRFSRHFGRYRIYLARSVEDGTVTGYMVLRKTETEKIKNVLNIVDILALPEHDGCVLRLLEHAIAEGQGLDIVRCRIPKWHSYVERLRQLGFVSFGSFLGWVKIYQPRLVFNAGTGDRSILQKRFYSLADTDDG